MTNLFSRKKPQPVMLAGLELSKASRVSRGERIRMLLAKGFLIYLILGGSLGCFVSCFNTPCNIWATEVFVLFFSMLFSVVYYNKKVRNIILIPLSSIFLFFMFVNAREISSGVYAFLNEISKMESDFFKSNFTREYTEFYSNRAVTMTYVAVLLGFILSVIMNISAAKKLRLGLNILLSLVFVAIPIFFERTPDTVFLVIYFAGLILNTIFNSSEIFEISLNLDSFHYNRKRNRLRCFFFAKNIFPISLIVLLLCMILVGVPKFFTKNDTLYGIGKTAFKEKAEDVWQEWYLHGGLYSLFSGSMNRPGTLGRNSRVSRDYETDFVLTYVPHSQERFYLKSFEGLSFSSANNQWLENQSDSTGSMIFFGKREKNTAAKYVQNAQEDEKAYNALAKIKYVDDILPVRPYFTSEEKRLSEEKTSSYRFYNSDSANMDFSKELKANYKEFLNLITIPERTREGIEKFLKSMGGFSAATPDELVREITDYFQENYPYTLNPGRTPGDRDFIDYFLNEQKTGYCSYYASAATMILRYYGVPAIYVEGYAVDPSDIVEHGKVVDEKYTDYFSGYNALNNEKVVAVEVTDACAHAWIEYFDFVGGWKIAETTPYSLNEDKQTSSWQDFLDFLSGRMSSEGGDDEPSFFENILAGEGFQKVIKVIGYIFLGLAAGFAVVVVVIFLIRRIRYIKASPGEKLLYKYGRFLKKTIRDNEERKGIATFEEAFAHTKLIEAIADEETRRKLLELLNRAAFSKEGITKDELELVDKSTNL